MALYSSFCIARHVIVHDLRYEVEDAHKERQEHSADQRDPLELQFL